MQARNWSASGFATGSRIPTAPFRGIILFRWSCIGKATGHDLLAGETQRLADVKLSVTKLDVSPVNARVTSSCRCHAAIHRRQSPYEAAGTSPCEALFLPLTSISTMTSNQIAQRCRKRMLFGKPRSRREAPLDTWRLEEHADYYNEVPIFQHSVGRRDRYNLTPIRSRRHAVVHPRESGSLAEAQSSSRKSRGVRRMSQLAGFLGLCLAQYSDRLFRISRT